MDDYPQLSELDRAMMPALAQLRAAYVDRVNRALSRGQDEIARGLAEQFETDVVDAVAAWSHRAPTAPDSGVSR
ncbi:hypothetical protein QEZ54_34935 [Catellatospora sp. KI3]|uniref:hypothetical protein n=1 Tax=Catellatospora sp. KI3 TaxID=3041620 RepID=UPI00248245FF|nr:hypothetical protein [Catellatospora sp. KI3]MDI1466185.1 hypothetical protein [Catellatospora sp. KI3]